jgi:hypothetical protein
LSPYDEDEDDALTLEDHLAGIQARYGVDGTAALRIAWENPGARPISGLE